MRLLIIRVPQGLGKDVLGIAEKHSGVNLSVISASGPEGAADVVFVHLSNRNVEPFLDELDQRPDVHITWLPQGVMTLYPPNDEAPSQVREVEARSPVEVYLGGLQSIGSWTGFVSYAAVAGFVVWIGLFTNTEFLLVAAMLIAPFAGPAMSVAMGTARGDVELIWRSALRYFTGISICIAVCAALSWLLAQQIATPLMISQSLVSSVTVLLPLTAGAAGAINLVQSQRNSLVSGAAVGMLVAASLAPPAGVVGMGMAVGEWQMVSDNFYLLLLQLVGINFSAAMVFRAFGLSTKGTRYPRGTSWVFPVGLMLTGVALACLLIFWQFRDTPNLQRSTRMARAAASLKESINKSGLARPVEVEARFTRASIEGQNTLLAEIFVQRMEGITSPSEVLREELTHQLQQRILSDGFNVTPLIDVRVLEKP